MGQLKIIHPKGLSLAKSLPPAPRSSDPDWIANEVHNLSRKKKETWVCLKNAPSQDITRLKAEYDHLRKLTKVAAEKAHNAWWSDRVAEQQGRGGSLIRDLRLLGKKFFKPASSNLVAKDGRVLQSDGDKLNRWAEHFQEVVNCQIDIDVIPIEDLPIVTPHSSSDTTLSDHDLSSPLSEEEIITAISELRAGKAPGPDGVSLEMLSLGEVTIRWLKSSLTQSGQLSQSLRTGKVRFLCLCTRKVAVLAVTTTVVLPF